MQKKSTSPNLHLKSWWFVEHALCPKWRIQTSYCPWDTCRRSAGSVEHCGILLCASQPHPGGTLNGTWQADRGERGTNGVFGEENNLLATISQSCKLLPCPNLPSKYINKCFDKSKCKPPILKLNNYIYYPT